jgi:hypothetical protein
MNVKDNVLLIAIGALIIGGLSGFIFATARGISAANDEPTQVAFNTKATDLRVELNGLLREHAVMGGKTLMDLYDGKDISAQEKILMTNSDNLKGVIGRVYGQEPSNKFADNWTAHMEEYKNYTLALRNGDQLGQENARQNLEKIAEDLGMLFGSESLPSEQVSALLKEHIGGNLAIVEAHAAADSQKEAMLVKASYDQAGKMADSLTQGITSDRSELFDR